jgi:hypothetical protein
MKDIAMEMNLQKALPNLFKKKEQNRLRRMIYIATSPEHLGMPYSEFREMPILMITELIEEHREYIKRKNNEAKKKK